MEFTTRVSGIPCRCHVTHYTFFKPVRITGSGYGDAEPPEYPEFEFRIKDRKGYQAPWLEKKLTLTDTQRLLEEFEVERLGERYGYL